ncbi:MAG TPA: hypothetical protein VK846_14645, partial [Candidatus Limnocylindria bacterium]|nr:hypothetical protein [Candidatus Limnocylindria bacterium]
VLRKPENSLKQEAHPPSIIFFHPIAASSLAATREYGKSFTRQNVKETSLWQWNCGNLDFAG